MKKQKNQKNNKRRMSPLEKWYLFLIGIILCVIILGIFFMCNTEAYFSTLEDEKEISVDISITVSQTTEEATEAETTKVSEITTTGIITETTTVVSTTETAETESESETVDISDLYITPDMDLSKTLGVSKEQFCLLMENLSCDYSGLFSRNAEEIWQLCQEYEVNEIFLVGLIGAESGWGNNEAHVSKCNYTSIMGSDGLNSYSSEYEGLYASVYLLSTEYLTENGQYYFGSTTIHDMASIYCPDNADTEEDESRQWEDLVYSCMSLVLSDMQEV